VTSLVTVSVSGTTSEARTRALPGRDPHWHKILVLTLPSNVLNSGGGIGGGIGGGGSGGSSSGGGGTSRWWWWWCGGGGGGALNTSEDDLFTSGHFILCVS